MLMNNRQMLPNNKFINNDQYIFGSDNVQNIATHDEQIFYEKEALMYLD